VAIFAAKSQQGDLDVIDGTTNEVIATIALAGWGDIAVDASTDTVYVSEGSAVAIIDGATDSVADTISLPGGAGAMAFDEATGVVRVAQEHAVVAISGTSDTVTETVSLSGLPAPLLLALNPTTDTV
jgi:DNA-binding beta-propeller fold protein YncE